MFTYKIYLGKKNHLFLRITNNRKKAELDTGLEATPQEWDKLQADGAAARRMRLYKTLSDFETKIKEIRNEYFEKGKSEADAKEIRDYIRAKVINSATYREQRAAELMPFASYVQKHIDSTANEGYKRTFEYMKSKVIEFTNENPDLTPHFYELYFEDMTVNWLACLDEWLVSKKIGKNSRSIVFRCIRTVFNKAINEDLTVAYPFKKFKIKGEATRKRALGVEDLRKLFNYDCEPFLEFYRDMFKLIFMLCGINTVDLYNLKHIRDGVIEYRRAKTGRLYTVKVEPEAMEIIEKYRGTKKLLNIADRWANHRNFNRDMNKWLKKIGKVEQTPKHGVQKRVRAEWPEISTYWARHSWATVAASLDIPKDTIAHALGHGNNTVTDIYIDFDHGKVDEANRRVIDWVLYGKKGQRRSNNRHTESPEGLHETSASSYTLTNTFENGSEFMVTYEL